jgi:hypothetical protein
MIQPVTPRLRYFIVLFAIISPSALRCGSLIALFVMVPSVAPCLRHSSHCTFCNSLTDRTPFMAFSLHKIQQTPLSRRKSPNIWNCHCTFYNDSIRHPPFALLHCTFCNYFTERNPLRLSHCTLCNGSIGCPLFAALFSLHFLQ